MELSRGDVIVNLKSQKEYAVVAVRAEYTDYVGIRNGKSFGPIRAGAHATVVRNFGKIAKSATFTTSTGWGIAEVK